MWLALHFKLADVTAVMRGLIARGQHGQEPPAACSCDCCEVAPRRSDEVVGGVALKCATSGKHSSDLCPEECSVPEDDQILEPTAKDDDGIVQTIRFCFYECQPLAGKKAPLESECVAFEPGELQLHTDSVGNPRDPAAVEVARASAKAKAKASQTSRTASLVAAKSKIDPDAANILARKMQRQAGFEAMMAGNEATATRNMEVAKADALNGRLKTAIEQAKGGGTTDPYQAMSDIASAKLRTEDEAKVAGEALQEAISSLQAGRLEAWKSAVTTGQAAVREAKNQEDAKAAEAAAKKAAAVNHVEERMKAAAAKAAEPYHLGMLRAQEQVGMYTSKAEGHAAEAVDYENKAKALQAAAQAAQDSGDMGLANTKIEEAKEMMDRAKEMAKTAKQFFATADQINMDLPKFSAAATAAAVAAAYAEQPAWHGTVFGHDKR